ncbi:hypothetical protein SAMN05192533_11783 [Mesobacillus persicus]|uniref:Uncharacterized protein n=1 Tax=Mesobacillus persicus TaxID=930146 RepID=A0A1H8IN03_9BACI|nr:hypothetical protein [Mesobacillus persicus]SEN69028.1 hypothetical protein SAMN05192533_11783 [Mesobacillus persicus]
MPTTKLTIVPVTLDPIHDTLPSVVPQSQSHFPNCVIKAAGVEISLFNGVDDRIVQVIMRELSNR